MSSTSMIERGVTVAQLAQYPRDDGNRYELIDGALYVTTQPHWQHQRLIGRLYISLAAWATQQNAGEVLITPGVILSAGDAVAPDLVWVRQERLHLLDDDGKLHGAPDLVVEILSAGAANAQRDRELKRALYERAGVLEYWIVDRFVRQVEVYHRAGERLELAAQVGAEGELASPLLVGFACPVAALFAGEPGAEAG